MSAARTTVSKQYVTDRIAARVASLKSRVKDAGVEIEGLIRKQRDIDRKWLRELSPKIAGIAIQIEQLLEGDRDDREFIEAAGQISSQLYSLKYSRPSLPTNDSGRLRELQSANASHQRELDLLEHALAYLKENPIEEYSVTSLQRLGLLDAVRFVLTPDAADKRGR